MSALAAPIRVLVVDDEPPILEIMSEALHDAGYLVGTATGGASAWRALRADPPDVLILDLMMPEVTARDVVNLVRADPRLCHIPILIVSAANGASTEASALGVQAFLSKPFEIETLLERVADLVGPLVSA